MKLKHLHYFAGLYPREKENLWFEVLDYLYTL
ncbi:MAG: hypothetical protein PWP57_350 [Candidatus Atribacteria bacterium]|nr:hypothetical protein [Candidatus Atribacteria bacterium]